MEIPISAMTKNVQTVIDHQKSQADNIVRDFLDNVTTKMLSDMTFQMQDQVKDAGIFAVMFPQEYSDFMRDNYRKPNYPFMQQAQCLVRGDESTTVDMSFFFVQPRLRRLKAKIVTVKGQQRFQDKRKTMIDGEEYHATVTEAVPREVSAVDLKLGDLINSRRMVKIEFQDKPRQEAIIDKDGKEAGRYVYEVPAVKGMLIVRAERVGMDPALFRVTVNVRNGTPCKSDTAVNYSDEEVARRSFYGTYIKLHIEGGSLVPYNSTEEPIRRELDSLANINTSPTVSAMDKNTVFSTPIIIHDFARYEPVSMGISLSELIESRQTLLSNLYLLSEKDKEKLKKANKLDKVYKVMLALSRTNPDKIKRLYKFQWDAIQVFIRKLLNGDHTPLLIRAPTDSGKSLIFYVCSVLKKELSDGLSGTIVFIMFPTRALNAQQFGEMVGFFFQLNKEGIEISLGLYMGTGDEDRETAVRSLWPPQVSEGQEIIDIEACPNCGHGPLIAHKPDEKRVVPKCTTCETELRYVFLSNMETESFCPSVIVGTPDKVMNALTTSVYAHTIFGAPCKKCPSCKRHMILAWKDQKDSVHKCPSCNTEMGPETLTRSTPCFVVFDEVHTLAGMQGNLLGHTLSLMNVVNDDYGVGSSYSYLGATATIHNQKVLVQNLTGFDGDHQTEFPTESDFWFNGKDGYFIRDAENIRHRYIVVEPLGRSARWSVANMTLSGYSIFKQALEADDAIVSQLKSKGYPVDKSYRIQTVYVLRKNDGRNMEKYIPDNAPRLGLERPIIRYGSGDLQRAELVQLNKLVKEQKIDVLVVTQIYGQGVDFPGLNVMHFFGMPRSFIELAQVVGRTGRGRLPGLIILHMVSEIPRDQWVLRNFRTVIEKLEDLYEPTPINVMNRHAMALSLPNILNALTMVKASQDYHMRFADYAHTYYSNKDNLMELLGQIYKVYLRPWVEDQKEIETIKKMLFNQLVNYILDFKDSKLDTTKRLALNRLLLSSLRDTRHHVSYTEQTSYPVLDDLYSSREAEEVVRGAGSE